MERSPWGFNPASNVSRFPEGGRHWIVPDHREVVTKRTAGQGEGWPVPFVVKFKVAGGKPVAKRVVDTG